MVFLGACRGSEPRLPVRTFALTPPELDQPAFEPSVAIDPQDPSRIIVAAQYGVGYNRGGRKIWSWQTADEGRAWEGAEIPLPRSNAQLAADVVTAFGLDGAPVVGFLFADSTFRGGFGLARGRRTGLGLGPASLVVPDEMDQGRGAVDKPWIAVDRGITSPLRGALYLTWHLNRPLPNRTVATELWIKSTRTGWSWSAPVKIAEEFGGQVVVRPDGTVDVVYVRGDGRALHHRWSTDGGRSFGEVDSVTRAAAPFELDLPTIAATRENRLAICWAADSARALESTRVRCTAGSESAGWSPPTSLDESRVTALPALAADGSDVWAAAYRSDSSRTAVVLYRSTDGGSHFREDRVLAERPFGIGQACLAPGGPCRKAPAEAGFFFPGDYLGLALSQDRIVAAYVLPEGELPTGRPTVYLTIVRIGSTP
jgi:hypothetical protein